MNFQKRPSNSPPGSRSTAAKETQAECIAGLRRREFRLPLGWLLVLCTGPSGLDFAYLVAQSWSVRIEVQRSRVGTISMSSFGIVVANRTLKKGRAGPGSKR